MSRLIVSLFFAVCLCVAFTSASSLFRHLQDAAEEAVFKRNQEKSNLEDDESEPELHVLASRFLKGMKEKATKLGNKAGEVLNKAQTKVKEAKDKAESIPNVDLSNLPGVGKRNMDGLMNGYVNPAVLNYLSNRQVKDNQAQEAESMEDDYADVEDDHE